MGYSLKTRGLSRWSLFLFSERIFIFESLALFKSAFFLVKKREGKLRGSISLLTKKDKAFFYAVKD